MQPPAPVKAGVHKHRSLKISLTCVWVHHVKHSHSVKGMTAQAQSQGRIHAGLLRENTETEKNSIRKSPPLPAFSDLRVSTSPSPAIEVLLKNVTWI